MRKLSVIVGVAMLATLASIAPAGATIDQIVEVEAGTQYTWEGTPTAGSNVGYFTQATVAGQRVPPDTPVTPAATCSKERNAYCDVLLVKITNPITDEEAAQGIVSKTANVSAQIDWGANVAPEKSDYDLVGYESDEFGARGTEVGSSGGVAALDGPTEQFSYVVTTSVGQPSVYLLLHVIYFAVPSVEPYAGQISVS